MNKEEYKKLVMKHSPQENRWRKIFVAFFVGGLLGFIGEVLAIILMETFALSKTVALMYVCLTMIFTGTLFTALGFFDNWVSKCKCGLIIPTTGFAHSVAASALDYKKDGAITGLGANFFKLAGSVLLYGIISAFFLVIVKVIIGG